MSVVPLDEQPTGEPIRSDQADPSCQRHDSPSTLIATAEDAREHRLAEELSAKRILSLTQPLEDASDIRFSDLFNLDDIQKLQDEFALATGVASIITAPDGTPITRPSNFTRLCRDLIRATKKGRANCIASDAELGRLSTSGPIIQPCLSGGLWDAGAGISVGGHHIANWLIGQVRDETQTDRQMRRYAREIGVDEEAFVEAFQEVPAMSKDQFGAIARALFTLANRLSTTAYQNVQQARFITEIKKTKENLRESENRLRLALEGANQGIWDVWIPTGKLYLSRRAWEILGQPDKGMVNFSGMMRGLVHPDDLAITQKQLDRHLFGNAPIFKVEQRLRMRSGQWKWVLTRGKVAEYAEDGRPLRMTGTYTDITERKQIDQAQMFLLERGPAVAGEDFFASLVQFLAELLSMDRVCVSRLEKDRQSARTLAVYFDGQHRENITYSLKTSPWESMLATRLCCYPEGVCRLFPGAAMLQEMAAESYAGTPLRDSRGKVIGLLSLAGRKPLANTYPLETILKLVAIRVAGELERREAEQEKELLQAQLIQTQKMESIGHLAGGVAHDFNNMLGVILGHVEMARKQADPSQPLFDHLHEIERAARRSTELTRQLLAFARKQPISPKILDLNDTVEGLLKMLRRLISEGIKLIWLPEKEIWRVKIDPTQVDQILANLTVNARDAIDGVGRITIETDNVVLDADYCAGHAGLCPGSYVMLAVSDDGCGMDREIQEHIFEPFYTTKGVGKGTGLGLATIYGIVKQNNGFIYVSSEPGQGTVFKIFLPKYNGPAEAAQGEKRDTELQRGEETILLVEDEAAILDLVKRMLESLGYRILAAGTPQEAVRLAEQQAGEVHLLMTDVIMPEMNGRELARHILSLYPDLKCLFMSGHTVDVIAHHGVLVAGVQFIQKPFSHKDLSTKVRDALGGQRCAI